MDSKANLHSYCLEVTKHLGIHYSAPPLPIHLNCTNTAAIVDPMMQNLFQQQTGSNFRSYGNDSEPDRSLPQQPEISELDNIVGAKGDSSSIRESTDHSRSIRSDRAAQAVDFRALALQQIS
jgi:hypothetical protein